MAKRHIVIATGFFLPFLSYSQEQINYPGWQDNFNTRLKALTLLETLNATLLSNDSATRTLQQWCADHNMADQATIKAIRDPHVVKEPDAEIRQQLQVREGEFVAYRHVQLVCGRHVLSEADNWYVPSRLTRDIDHLLTSTEMPFGIAVKSLKFSRKTNSVNLLWSPLPTGWELKAPKILETGHNINIPEYVLQHKAVLSGSNRVPFSVVVENYRRDIFSFPLDQQ